MKRAISALLAAALLLLLLPAVSAASEEALQAADRLNALGLFSGTGTNADGSAVYELDRSLTRQEAVTLLVKLAGGAEEAAKGGWDTPFTDVDNWAKNWVGYAYHTGLTAGLSPSVFGANDAVTAAQFLTFLLKLLGYSATEDFRWDAAWLLSDAVGLTCGEYGPDTPFTRGDAAILSARALDLPGKDGPRTLLEQLTDMATPAAMTRQSFSYDSVPLNYWLYAPENAGAGLPLIVYLHGGSGRGADLDLLTCVEGFPQYLMDGRLGAVPAYVVMPQLDSAYTGWEQALPALLALLEQLTEQLGLDPDRISLTGHSMGGTGTWALAAACPDVFSCVAPLSGSVLVRQNTLAALSTLPVWTFVGSADTVVDPARTQTFVRALAARSQQVQLTVLDGAGHRDVPALAYLEYGLVDWLIGHNRDE